MCFRCGNNCNVHSKKWLLGENLTLQFKLTHVFMQDFSCFYFKSVVVLYKSNIIAMTLLPSPAEMSQ